ncbi:tetratricopeptide repeat protein, partial [Actinocorallia lasiicapitis]
EAALCAIETSRALIGLGRLDEAITRLRSALAEPPRQELDPIVAQAQLVLAQAELARGDVDAALLVLRTTSIHLDRFPPSRATASLARELGDLFDTAGDGAAATNAYRRALESVGLRPTHQPTQALADH